MTAFRAVVLACDVWACGRRITVRVTTTAGGVHQARDLAAAKGWSFHEVAGDHCPTHSV